MRRHRLAFYLFATLFGSAAFAEGEKPTVLDSPEAIFTRLRNHIVNEPLAFDTTFVAHSQLLGILRGSAQFLIGRPNLSRVSITDGHKSYRIVSNADQMTILDTKTELFAHMPPRWTPGEAYGVLTGLMSVKSQVLNFLGLLENISAHDRNIQITAAGSGSAGGQECGRFKVTETWRTETKTWDVWLEKSEPHLPCQFVFHSTEALSEFSQTNEFKWGPRPVVAADDFVFTPPAGGKEVSASELDLHPPTKSWR